MVCEPQTLFKPEIETGVAGAELVLDKVNLLSPLVPQLFTALTAIVPPLKVVPKLTVIELVVEVPEAPTGNVHW